MSDIIRQFETTLEITVAGESEERHLVTNYVYSPPIPAERSLHGEIISPSEPANVEILQIYIVRPTQLSHHATEMIEISKILGPGLIGALRQEILETEINTY